MKNNLIWIAVLLIGVVLIGYSFLKSKGEVAENLPTPSPSANPSVSPSKSPIVSRIPLPTGSSQTPQGEASCQLQGEIKFLSSNLYDNQDAKFIYKGIDHPGRNVFWTVTPQDNLSIGPNIFTKLPIPDGESLLGIVLPAQPKSKRYELTAKVQYGRLVDGAIKVFEKQCSGKATVVLP